ncbi:DDB1- and CUL4-associated factor 12-like [Actinia tenebrosa]|uniref:DDB1- and CUL4-associated factor 12-like n=1 Tax=Actinia tenebrosa TaxID=6105 RepID=A0A6P8IFM7_ACTTE|nr:DDB1- and CUL4-associated factor 12-like [Actinia tenebrosa]
MKSVFEYLSTRRQSTDAKLSSQTVTDLISHRVPLTWKPSNVPLGTIDKVFASKWLDDRRVICGTKCNQLVVIDVVTKERVFIPMLEGSPHATPQMVSAGVHDIALNQSQTMLASNGENPNHLAVYKLPTFDPVCVGEGHSDWVFATEWIDDRLLATGSRDGTISIWNTYGGEPAYTSNKLVGTTNGKEKAKIMPAYVSPKTTLTGTVEADRIRDLAYNSNTGNLAALSPHSLVHVWDIASGKQLSSFPLPFYYENVCLALEKDRSLYAIGSQSHVSLVDLRSYKMVKNIRTYDPGAGVRSVSFQDVLLTIGTGHGSVVFYDLVANGFLVTDTKDDLTLKSGKGWLRLDNTLYEYFTETEVDCFSNAIYTHCYDPTGTKLFTAGGPLALVLYGNYAAVWE